MRDPTQSTIEDFGAQWMRFRGNEDYYGSVAMLHDILSPLLLTEEIAGMNVAEIGSGSGRIALMLLRVGAGHVTAIEPSQAIDVLRTNTSAFGAKIDCIHGRGEAIPRDRNFDYVFSIGVLHHIPDPAPVVRAALEALRPGGRMLVWLYGREGNEAYLSWAIPLRKMTKRLPDTLLSVLCYGLNVILGAYILLCRFLPLPMRGYVRGHISKLSWHARFLTLFDQLNPSEARYYRRAEAQALLANAGFGDVQLYNRHGYSWTVIGTKPSRG
jgi:SAM-dependent methyltransferase